MKMKKGERAIVTITDPLLAFGDSAVDGPLALIPPACSPIVYEVELLAFENVRTGS
jgi:hypothetical protein